MSHHELHTASCSVTFPLVKLLSRTRLPYQLDYSREPTSYSIRPVANASMAAPNSNSGVSGLFDLNYPPSPAPSSPTFETSDTEQMSLVNEDRHVTEDAGMPPQLPSIVEQLVTTLLSTYPHHRPLHHTAATLTDVEALIPTLNNNILVMSKLAENVGYFCSSSSTPTNPSPELENILVHIFTQGDKDNRMYEMTKMQLQCYNERLCQLDPSRRLRMHEEAIAREQYLKTQKCEAKQRKKGMPAHMKQRFPPGQLPIGCLSPSDVVTECYGMGYAEYMRIPQSKVKMEECKAISPELPSPDLPTNLPKGEDFSRTRLHNGPGLTDRKRPKVRLPQTDSRRTPTVLVMPALEDRSAEREDIWARTKVECQV
jgi:hypothetical protein